VSLTSNAWFLVGLGLFGYTPIASRLRDWLTNLLRLPHPTQGGAPPLRLVLAFGVVMLLGMNLWALPFRIAGRMIEIHYGFSRQSWGGFAKDQVLGYCIALLVIPFISGAYWLYSRSPRRWWLWGWLGLVPLLCVQMVLYPLFISPLYNRFSVLPESALKGKILRLADQAGIPNIPLLIEDTSKRTRHVNAYVTGIGASRRVVLNDTAITTLPEDQLLAVVGHEIGHYVEGHIWVGLVSSLLGAGLFLWFAAWLFPHLAEQQKRRLEGVQDIAFLPIALLVLNLFLLLQAPLATAESRYLERRADAYGIRLTGYREATAQLQKGFAERDYIDPNPPRLLHLWFGTHPTIRERIAFALSH
jgi:Zn-dependent protease with chaperone function